MLVLIGPDFDGTSDAYTRLARITGLVQYDLKARIRPGAWGVVKLLADPAQAEALASELSDAGFRPMLVSREVAHDPERKIVHAKGLTLEDAQFVLHFTERDMPIEYGALSCVVRGEVHPGRAAPRAASSASSGSLRAVNPTGEPPSVREPQPFESYHAADLHFLTVPWIARVDVRAVGTATGDPSVRALDALVDDLASRSRVRVDRAVRTSSLASFAEQAVSARSVPPDVQNREHRREQPDDRFDPYSRLIGEAERLSRA